MRNELTQLIIWFNTNKLSLNISKTNYVLFSPKNLQINIDFDDTCVLKFGDEYIQGKDYVKFLGMFLDKHLDWSQQFVQLRVKLARTLYIMNSSKNILPLDCRKTLYYSLFYSHLIYGMTLWGHGMSACNVNIIEK